MEKQSIIILSIALLVSNRKDTIRNCMEGLRPLLEKIPSELIIVDTIGEENSDGSLAIAREYATKVVHFEWCNDFSAARNAGLFEAVGKWFMFIDDDEWFENVDELVEFFESGEYLQYESGTYLQRNYKDAEGMTYTDVPCLRIIKRTAELKFVGTIHETFSKVSLPCKDFKVYVHHYGYVYANEEQKKKHSERNMVLLKEELKRNPGDMRYRAQMALELANYDNKRALDFCEETFRFYANQKNKSSFQWQLSLVFCLYEALGTAVEEAEKSYNALKQQFGFSETAETAICFQMTRICILKNEPERGITYALRYFDAFLYLQQNPQIRQLQMTADFSRYQTEDAYLEMLHYGAYCALRAKEYEQAWMLYSSMPWERMDYSNVEGLNFILQLYKECANQAELLNIIKRLMKNSVEVQKEEIRNLLTVALAMMREQ